MCGDKYIILKMVKHKHFLYIEGARVEYKILLLWTEHS